MVAKIVAQTRLLSPLPDVVVGFNLYQYGTASGVYGGLYRTPSVAMAVGSDVDQVFDWNTKLLTWISLRLNRHVCVLTTEQQQKLFHRVQRNFCRIPYSFDEMPNIGRSEARGRHHLRLDRIYLIGVGRLQASRHGHIKGFDRLLEAVCHLPQCHLLVIGDGPLRPSYQKFIDDNRLSERVRLLGSVSRETVWDYLAAADIFVLPSVHEGLSVAMIEALGFGLPVVASRIGGTVDLLQHGVNGLLVAPGDSAALESALQLLASDEAMRERMGRAALQSFRDHFNARIVARAWQEMLYPSGAESR
jgi:glycosyltransferase involved in cell wall biosynthesis